MSVPDWWEATLLALAAYRTWKLAAADSILDRPRARLFDDHSRLDAFVACQWCFGFWLALAWWAVWQAWPTGTLVAATPLALSAAVGALADRLDADSA